MATRNFRYVVYKTTPKPDGKPDYYAQTCEKQPDGGYVLECANQDGSLRTVTLFPGQVGSIEDLGSPKM